jgi:hypothetical protein
VSAPAYREITASADFHGATHSGQVAADVDFDNSTPITGVEDHGVNFGSQLKQMVTLGTADIGTTSSASSSLVSSGRQRTGAHL